MVQKENVPTFAIWFANRRPATAARPCIVSYLVCILKQPHERQTGRQTTYDRHLFRGKTQEWKYGAKSRRDRVAAP